MGTEDPSAQCELSPKIAKVLLLRVDSQELIEVAFLSLCNVTTHVDFR